MRSLDRSHLDHNRFEAERFLQSDLIQLTLTKAQFQLSNEFYSQYADVPLLELRVTAVVGMMMIRAYSRHNRKMTEFIHSRINTGSADDSLDNTFIVDKLYTILDAYIGDYTLKETSGTRTIEKIIDRAVGEHEFRIEAGGKYGMME